MSGRCVEKIKHICGTKDGLQIFYEKEVGYTGYCFSCDTYIPSPYGTENQPIAPEFEDKKDTKRLKIINTYQTVPLPERKLKEWALKYFEIKIGLSERDGTTPILHYYPYYNKEDLVAYKARLIENKKMWVEGDMANVDPFGWKQSIATGARRLIITEGELDAVAIYQALKEKSMGTAWDKYEPAVISLSRGASSVNLDLIPKTKEINGLFESVILAFDQDEAGEQAVRKAKMIFPAASVASLPAKDANASVIEGRSKALANALVFRYKEPKKSRLVWAPSLYTEAMKPAEWGMSWPWKGMTELTRGIRFGETYYLGAGVKMGKSEIVNTLAAHFITNHNLKAFLAKPEEANAKTIKMVLGKVAGKIFHDPSKEFDRHAYNEAAQLVGDRLCMLDLYQMLDWNDLRTDIFEAAEEGCRAIFIDPITNLVNGISSGETNTILQGVSQELAALVKDLNIVAFIFCHLKAPTSGEPHERGGKVLSHQFAGSRAMMRSCNMMLGLEGNKDPDLPEESKNIRDLIILEDREFGVTGKVKLYWDKETSLFNEVVK